MYILPSGDIVVQTCRGVGQVLLYYVQKRVGMGTMVWYISNISISLLWARCRRLCVHGVTLYSTEGVQFREVLERFVWNGYILCRSGPRFSKCTLRNRGVLRFVVRVVCSDGD